VASQPSFECPVGSAESIAGVEEFAAAIGVSPAWLLRRIQHNGGRHRAHEGGPLLDTCDSCGHKLTRLGFGYWIEGAPPEDASEGQRATSAIRKRFGGDGFVRVEGPWYAKTKADGLAWAHGRAKEGS
jgi:hypothetical protein